MGLAVYSAGSLWIGSTIRLRLILVRWLVFALVWFSFGCAVPLISVFLWRLGPHLSACARPKHCLSVCLCLLCEVFWG